MSKKTVLVVGARGFVGSQVLDAVLRKNQVNNNEEKYTVMTLIRPGSNASAIEAKGGVGVARGDMMDATSLVTAFTNVDTVISIANGYMSGMPEVDTVGMKNVVDACKAAGVQRYVYENNTLLRTIVHAVVVMKPTSSAECKTSFTFSGGFVCGIILQSVAVFFLFFFLASSLL
jgi:UDP-glucose 4-epimerase